MCSPRESTLTESCSRSSLLAGCPRPGTDGSKSTRRPYQGKYKWLALPQIALKRGPYFLFCTGQSVAALCALMLPTHVVDGPSSPPTVRQRLTRCRSSKHLKTLLKIGRDAALCGTRCLSIQLHRCAHFEYAVSLRSNLIQPPYS